MTGFPSMIGRRQRKSGNAAHRATRRGACMLGLAALLPRPARAQDDAALLAQAETLPPATLYMLAARLFAAGQRDAAVRWLYVAQLRARFHLAVEPGLRPDAEPALYAALNEQVGRPVNEWAFGDVDGVAREMQAALDWDAAHPNGFTPKQGRDEALQRIRAGLAQLRARLVSQRAEIRRQRQENGLENR
jgi:hypothetical protein